MRRILLVLSVLVVSGCTSDEKEARILVGEARALHESAQADWKEKSFDGCISKATSAQEKLEQMYKKYPSSTVSNEISTKSLKGLIQGNLSECSRIKKVIENPPQASTKGFKPF